MTEVVGAVGAVVSIASEGFKLSNALYVYFQKVKHAQEDVERISKDVKNTAVVLKQLEENLKLELGAQVCSEEFYQALTQNLKDCGDVFKSIRSMLTEASKKTDTHQRPDRASMKARDRLKWPFNNNRVALCRSDLDRLKLDMSLKIDVMRYRRDIHDRRVLERQNVFNVRIARHRIELLRLETEAAEAKFQDMRSRSTTTQNLSSGNTDDHEPVRNDHQPSGTEDTKEDSIQRQPSPPDPKAANQEDGLKGQNRIALNDTDTDIIELIESESESSQTRVQPLSRTDDPEQSLPNQAGDGKREILQFESRPEISALAGSTAQENTDSSSQAGQVSELPSKRRNQTSAESSKSTKDAQVVKRDNSHHALPDDTMTMKKLMHWFAFMRRLKPHGVPTHRAELVKDKSNTNSGERPDPFAEKQVIVITKTDEEGVNAFHYDQQEPLEWLAPPDPPDPGRRRKPEDKTVDSRWPSTMLWPPVGPQRLPFEGPPSECRNVRDRVHCSLWPHYPPVQGTDTLMELWQFRRYVSPQVQDKSWGHATRSFLPLDQAELHLMVKKFQRKEEPLWTVFSKLTSYQQRQIQLLLFERTQFDLYANISYTLQAIVTSPKRTKPANCKSLQVILERRPQFAPPAFRSVEAPPGADPREYLDADAGLLPPLPSRRPNRGDYRYTGREADLLQRPPKDYYGPETTGPYVYPTSIAANLHPITRDRRYSSDYSYTDSDSYDDSKHRRRYERLAKEEAALTKEIARKERELELRSGRQKPTRSRGPPAPPKYPSSRRDPPKPPTPMPISVPNYDSDSDLSTTDTKHHHSKFRPKDAKTKKKSSKSRSKAKPRSSSSEDLAEDLISRWTKKDV